MHSANSGISKAAPKIVLKSVFCKYDTYGSGRLDRNAFANVLLDLGIDDEVEQHALFALADNTNSKYITFDKFLNLIQSNDFEGILSNEEDYMFVIETYQNFLEYDTDGSGEISWDKFYFYLHKHGYSHEYISNYWYYINQNQTNATNTITFEQFWKAFRAQSEAYKVRILHSQINEQIQLFADENAEQNIDKKRKSIIPGKGGKNELIQAVKNKLKPTKVKKSAFKKRVGKVIEDREEVSVSVSVNEAREIVQHIDSDDESVHSTTPSDSDSDSVVSVTDSESGSDSEDYVSVRRNSAPNIMSPIPQTETQSRKTEMKIEITSTEDTQNIKTETKTLSPKTAPPESDRAKEERERKERERAEQLRIERERVKEREEKERRLRELEAKRVKEEQEREEREERDRKLKEEKDRTERERKQKELEAKRVREETERKEREAKAKKAKLEKERQKRSIAKKQQKKDKISDDKKEENKSESKSKSIEKNEPKTKTKALSPKTSQKTKPSTPKSAKTPKSKKEKNKSTEKSKPKVQKDKKSKEEMKTDSKSDEKNSKSVKNGKKIAKISKNTATSMEKKKSKPEPLSPKISKKTKPTTPKTPKKQSTDEKKEEIETDKSTAKNSKKQKNKWSEKVKPSDSDEKKEETKSDKINKSKTDKKGKKNKAKTETDKSKSKTEISKKGKLKSSEKAKVKTAKVPQSKPSDSDDKKEEIKTEKIKAKKVQTKKDKIKSTEKTEMKTETVKVTDTDVKKETETEKKETKSKKDKPETKSKKENLTKLKISKPKTEIVKKPKPSTPKSPKIPKNVTSLSLNKSAEKIQLKSDPFISPQSDTLSPKTANILSVKVSPSTPRISRSYPTPTEQKNMKPKSKPKPKKIETKSKKKTKKTKKYKLKIKPKKMNRPKSELPKVHKKDKLKAKNRKKDKVKHRKKKHMERDRQIARKRLSKRLSLKFDNLPNKNDTKANPLIPIAEQSSKPKQKSKPKLQSSPSAPITPVSNGSNKSGGILLKMSSSFVADPNSAVVSPPPMAPPPVMTNGPHKKTFNPKLINKTQSHDAVLVREEKHSESVVSKPKKKRHVRKPTFGIGFNLFSEFRNTHNQIQKEEKEQRRKTMLKKKKNKLSAPMHNAAYSTSHIRDRSMAINSMLGLIDFKPNARSHKFIFRHLHEKVNRLIPADSSKWDRNWNKIYKQREEIARLKQRKKMDKLKDFKTLQRERQAKIEEANHAFIDPHYKLPIYAANKQNWDRDWDKIHQSRQETDKLKQRKKADKLKDFKTLQKERQAKIEEANHAFIDPHYKLPIYAANTQKEKEKQDKINQSRQEIDALKQRKKADKLKDFKTLQKEKQDKINEVNKAFINPHYKLPIYAAYAGNWDRDWDKIHQSRQEIDKLKQKKKADKHKDLKQLLQENRAKAEEANQAFIDPHYALPAHAAANKKNWDSDWDKIYKKREEIKAIKQKKREKKQLLLEKSSKSVHGIGNANTIKKKKERQRKLDKLQRKYDKIKLENADFCVWIKRNGFEDIENVFMECEMYKMDEIRFGKNDSNYEKLMSDDRCVRRSKEIKSAIQRLEAQRKDKKRTGELNEIFSVSFFGIDGGDSEEKEAKTDSENSFAMPLAMPQLRMRAKSAHTSAARPKLQKAKSEHSSKNNKVELNEARRNLEQFMTKNGFWQIDFFLILVEYGVHKAKDLNRLTKSDRKEIVKLAKQRGLLNSKIKAFKAYFH